MQRSLLLPSLEHRRLAPSSFLATHLHSPRAAPYYLTDPHVTKSSTPPSTDPTPRLSWRSIGPNIYDMMFWSPQVSTFSQPTTAVNDAASICAIALISVSSSSKPRQDQSIEQTSSTHPKTHTNVITSETAVLPLETHVDNPPSTET